MASYLDKMNLRPQERRLVVGVLIVVFIVLNVWLVWPRFGDWAKVKADLEKAHMNFRDYKQKIAQVEGPNGFRARLTKLEGENAGDGQIEEQELQLLRTVQSQVQEAQITVNSYGPVSRSIPTGQSTNEFFEEQSIKISINTGEKELVDFLLNIGTGGSMIRVRDLDLKPADQNRYRLQGSITLSANYQKKQPAKSGAAAAKPAAPAVKPPPAGAKKS
jgi:Tfp pilus assembly protein PilO